MKSFCLKGLERSSKKHCGTEKSCREAGQGWFTQSHPPKTDPEARSPNSDGPLLPCHAALELSTGSPQRKLNSWSVWPLLDCSFDRISGFNNNGIKNCFGRSISQAYFPKFSVLGRHSSPRGPYAFWPCQSLHPQFSIPQEQPLLYTNASTHCPCCFLCLHIPLCPACETLCPHLHLSNSIPTHALKLILSPTPSSSSSTHYLI